MARRARTSTLCALRRRPGPSRRGALCAQCHVLTLTWGDSARCGDWTVWTHRGRGLGPPTTRSSRTPELLGSSGAAGSTGQGSAGTRALEATSPRLQAHTLCQITHSLSAHARPLSTLWRSSFSCRTARYCFSRPFSRCVESSCSWRRVTVSSSCRSSLFDSAI